MDPTVNTLSNGRFVLRRVVFILPSRILLDIEQLMRGFLWCQGDMRKEKAKVAWERLISLKESLWVRWIHAYKLKGQNFWDLPIQGNMTWGWRKILRLRPVIRQFIWYRIGDGSTASMWPPEWPVKYPPLLTIIVPTINLNVTDVLEWQDMWGKLLNFSVATVWDCIRPRGDEANWFGIRESSESLGLVQDLPQSKLEGLAQQSKKCVRTLRKSLPRFLFTRTEPLLESEDSGGGHWKSKSRKQKSSIEEEDLSQPWICEEADPFTPQIRYFELPKKSRMLNNVKTYDGSDDPEDHLKIFQATTKVEHWAMPTWCYVFNYTLTGSVRVWFDDLPSESIDSYDDLKKAFLANYLQQKNCIKDPVEIHHIKQIERESTKDFVQMFKAESRHGEVAASNQAQKKAPPIWKEQEVGRKQNFDRRGDFRNQRRSERRRDKFTLLIKSPKEILALDKGKFKALPPMTTHQKGSAKDSKKGETSGKDKPLAILMVQPWQRVARQKVTQSFSPSPEILFPPFRDKDGTEGPMITEAKIGGNFIYRIYVDGGSASEILYEQCFNRIPNGINIAPSKNRICGAFHLYNDELYGSKITVSIQRDHKKARSEEDPSSPVYSSRNAKIPSPRRDTHSSEQQDNPTRMHNEHPEQTIAIGSTLTEEGQKAFERKEKKPGTRKKQSNTIGGGKTGGCWHNERSPLSQLVIKSSKGEGKIGTSMADELSDANTHFEYPSLDGQNVSDGHRAVLTNDHNVSQA
ncbi:reverse transcriptase domain-containing protein [Tanacetum coccineum]